MSAQALAAVDGSAGAWDRKGHALVVIETPKGSPNKLKYDPALHSFRLSKVLPAGMVFPFDFGYLPATHGADGDPLDVLVLMDAPVYPGCIVPSRLIGVLEAEQEDGKAWVRNDRLIAVATKSITQRGLRRLGDVDDTLLGQLEGFFRSYNEIGGRGFRVTGRRGPKAARRVVKEAS